MRRTTCCHTFIAFILKSLIFFQTFIGISIIIYSAFMLNQWNKHLPNPPPPSPSPSPPSPSPLSPSPSPLSPSPLSPSPNSEDSVFSIFTVSHFNFADDPFTTLYHLQSNPIPAPWFIYAFMGLGVVLCCISCIGHIAAEAIHGCCLCVYTVLKVLLILIEVALVAFIALDQRWEKDLPEDPTGGIDNIREFIQNNIDICKWVGIVIIVIQVLCILLAVLLRMMVSTRNTDDDLEEGSRRGKAWEPLLNPQSTQASGSTSGDSKAFHSDIWSLRMREKYGLNGNQSNQSA